MARQKKLLTVVDEPKVEQEEVIGDCNPADVEAIVAVDADVPNEETVNAIVEARAVKPVKKAKKAVKKVAKKAKKVSKKAVKKTAKKKAKK